MASRMTAAGLVARRKADRLRQQARRRRGPDGELGHLPDRGEAGRERAPAHHDHGSRCPSRLGKRAGLEPGRKNDRLHPWRRSEEDCIRDAFARDHSRGRWDREISDRPISIETSSSRAGRRTGNRFSPSWRMMERRRSSASFRPRAANCPTSRSIGGRRRVTAYDVSSDGKVIVLREHAGTSL